MKRLLVRFWAVTPVGKLQFNREGPYDWRMLGTKGQITSVRGVLPRLDVKAEDVLDHFGWPPNVLHPYGHTYEEEETKRIEPICIIDIRAPGEHPFLVVGNRILWFKDNEELGGYRKQQLEKI